jgi:hypothetical protein
VLAGALRGAGRHLRSPGGAERLHPRAGGMGAGAGLPAGPGLGALRSMRP